MYYLQIEMNYSCKYNDKNEYTHELFNVKGAQL